MKGLLLTTRLILIFSSLIFPSSLAVAQTPSVAESEAAMLATDSGPVAVPEPSEKAVRYHRGGLWIWLLEMTVGLLLPAAFLPWETGAPLQYGHLFRETK